MTAALARLAVTGRRGTGHRIMQAAPSGMKNVKSEFTLALLETRVVQARRSKAELMSWGYKGCSFVDSADLCQPADSAQRWPRQTMLIRPFRDGLCKNDGQYMDGCPITRADYMCSDLGGHQ